MTRNRERGFSSIELTVAMAIGAMLLGVVLQTVSQVLPRWRVRQTAEDIASAVRWTRAKAVRTRTIQLLPFDLDGNRYSKVLPGPDSSSHVVVNLPRDVKFASPNGGTNPIDVQPSPGDLAVEYSSRGRLVSTTMPGHIHVGDTRRGIYSRVTVDLVGSVKIEQWKNGSWQ